MDFVSALVGAAIAGASQVLSHFLGSMKDRAARRLAFYEARLVEARELIKFYEECADDLDMYGPAPGEGPDIAEKLRDTFGDGFAGEAARAMFAKDNGESFRATVVRMRAHVAELERKTGVPKRLS